MEKSIGEIISLLKDPTEEDKALITKAYEFAKEAHEGQKRKSGEPYFTHPFSVACSLAEMQLGAPTIAAGLLHDVCEDCNIHDKHEECKDHIEANRTALEKIFNAEIAGLVDGVTKLGKIKYRGEQLEIESLRKMFIAMARDIRVVIIRLADRLHNMQTLGALPKHKQRRIAVETQEIYVPIANRLGMGEMKGELEDLVLLYTKPKIYAEIKDLLKQHGLKQKSILKKIQHELRTMIEEDGIDILDLQTREKHICSLYRKLQRQHIDGDISRVYDLIALRVIVPTESDCYKALGVIHSKWRPLPGRMKNYIALPKPNGYQSLHTVVYAANGTITEIQIRTRKMHNEAEYGIAAHWAYKERGHGMSTKALNKKLAWVGQLVEFGRQFSDSESKEFLESLRMEFFTDRVFCITPKGDIVELPEGATVIDFAYAIHSDIGNTAVGALVNDKFVGIHTVLYNNDVVEIKTQKNKKPNADWLPFAKTSLAKKHIRAKSKSGIFEAIKTKIRRR